jgi:hypothetical protein
VLKADFFSMIAPFLNTGEKVVWAGRPSPLARAVSKIPDILMGLIFAGIGFIWTGNGFGFNTGSLALLGIPLVAVGLVLFLSPLWAFVEAHGWLFYAVTEERLLFIRLIPRAKAEAYCLSDIVKLGVSSRRDGSGTISFERLVEGRGMDRAVKIVEFFGVPEAARVAGAIARLKDGRKVML